MDTSKVKAFLVKPVYKKVKAWHIIVAVLVIIAASSKGKKGSGGSGNYDDTCCCSYYEAAKTGRPSSDIITETMDFEECMRLNGQCQQDKSKCY